MLENEWLTNQEKYWLSFMQTEDKAIDDILKAQISSAKIERAYDKYLIIVNFFIPKHIKPLDIENGTPIELRVFRKTMAPIQMFLHVRNGYIVELEVFSADSSEISELETIDNYEVILDIKRS